MDWLYYLLIVGVFGTLPALASICYLLPQVEWSTRFKVLISRGVLKFPFGVLFGFLGVLLIEILRLKLIPSAFVWGIISLAIYVSLIWIYLFLYKLMLNKIFKQAITWKAIINSIMIELGLIALLIVIALGISITVSFSL